MRDRQGPVRPVLHLLRLLGASAPCSAPCSPFSPFSPGAPGSEVCDQLHFESGNIAQEFPSRIECLTDSKQNPSFEPNDSERNYRNPLLRIPSTQILSNVECWECHACAFNRKVWWILLSGSLLVKFFVTWCFLPPEPQEQKNTNSKS